MYGTRYGDFSRTLNGGHDKVLAQQGRVQLDADWNAQVEATDDKLRRALADAFGGSCGPGGDTGYEIHREHAVVLDGHGAIEIDDWQDVLAAGGREHTIELWLTWHGQLGTILHCGRHGEADAGLRVHVHSGGQVECEDLRDRRSLVRGERPLRRHKRSHLALVHREHEVSLYLDGEHLGRAKPDSRPREPEFMHVGGSRPDPHRGAGFHGLVGAVHVWPHARTQDELHAARHVPLAEPHSHEGAIAAWHVGEHEQTVHDHVHGHRARVREGRGVALHRLTVGRGRYYVDGVRCELAKSVSFDKQLGCAPQPLPQRGHHLLYLETWETSVDATVYPSLREVALGGIDTSVLTKTVSCVRAAHLHPHEPDDRHDAVRHALRAAARPTSGRMAADHVGERAPGNYMYRVEIHSGGAVGEDAEGTPAKVVEADRLRSELVLGEEWASEEDVGREVELTGRDGEGHHVSRHHTIAGVRPDPQGQRLLLANEVHDLADVDELAVAHRRVTPTFKWSRRNGAETFAIAPAEAGSREVRLIGRASAYEPLARGDLVEILDARVPLEGLAHPLLRVELVGLDGEVQLSEGVPSGVARHESDRPFLRRWDGTAPATDRWRELESGIRVKFERGKWYARSDYWWMVARQDGRAIEWPHEHGHPVMREPDGVERRVAPLALLSLDDERSELRDLRRIYRARHERAGDEPGRHRHEREEHGDHEREQEKERHHRHEDHGHEHHHHEPRGLGERDLRELDLAIIGPARAPRPGFVRTGIEVLTRPHWRRLATLDIPARDVEGVTGRNGEIVIATVDALWWFDGRTLRREVKLPERRHGYALCGIDELLLVIGGRAVGGRRDGRVHAFHVERGEWSERKRMPKRHEGHAAVAAHGHVHVLGGQRSRWHSRAHHTYDHRADRWHRAPALPKRRAHHSAVLAGPVISVVGGEGMRGRTLRHHAEYDPETRRWHHAEPLPRAHRVRDGAAHGGRHVALVHDHARDDHHHVVVHDRALGRWDSLPPLPGGVKPVALAARGESAVALAEERPGKLRIYEMRFTGDWAIFVPERAGRC